MSIRTSISDARRQRGWSGIEALVVLGIVVLIGAVAYPLFAVQTEQARMRKAQAQLQALQAAIEKYHSTFHAYPASGLEAADNKASNSSSEALYAALSIKVGGVTILSESLLAAWRGDADSDGRPEFVDPWGTPWIYFDAASYGKSQTVTMNGRTDQVKALKSDMAAVTQAATPASGPKPEAPFMNPGTYQLWSCGANRTSEDGWGDDVIIRTGEAGGVKGKKK